jgi:hypothetical protein
MSSSFDDAVSRLTSQSDAVGRLAQDNGGFAAVVAAFESSNSNAFRWVLERLEMLPYCELICDWLRIKLCVLRCHEVCGPLRADTEIPNLDQFAIAAVRLASNETLLRRVVDAVGCGDASEYQAAIKELDLGEFCHLICAWVCTIGYREVCEVICRPEPVAVADAVSEIHATGRLLADLIENKGALASIGDAAVSLNCERLQAAISDAGFVSQCEIICRFVCVWRRVWVCRQLCRVSAPIVTGVYAVEEAQNFAIAARQLAGQPRALGDLVSAVESLNTKSYSAVIDRFNLGPYCWQVCAWVISVTCHEFCECVCPKGSPKPIFTSVGSFGIYSDIDPTTGKTNTGAYGFGGPDYAFWSQLQFGGFCPSFSPIASAVSMQYRFLYSTLSTTLASGISAAQTTITVASSVGVPSTPFDVAVCAIPGNPVEFISVTGVSGTTWTVSRAQEGTTAAAAGIGSTLAINPQPVTGPLVSDDAPLVPVCSREIPWAQFIPGIPPTAGPTTAATPQSQQVILYPSSPPPDPTNLPVGSPWTGPTAHYIVPDANGWVPVDPNSEFGGFTPLMVFDSTQVVAGGEPVPFGNFSIGSSAPNCVLAGQPVPPALQKGGMDLSIIFQATRAGVSTIDYSNALPKIHVNNWLEVNELNFAQFANGCCTPIDASLDVEFTVDHEELNAGTWSLTITSCSPSAPGNVTPPYPPAVLPAGDTVAFTAGDRGASGDIEENTSEWCNCSYVVQLNTTPKLTTGLQDRSTITNQLTFAICDHSC